MFFTPIFAAHQPLVFKPYPPFSVVDGVFLAAFAILTALAIFRKPKRADDAFRGVCGAFAFLALALGSAFGFWALAFAATLLFSGATYFFFYCLTIGSLDRRYEGASKGAFRPETLRSSKMVAWFTLALLWPVLVVFGLAVAAATLP